jgi:cystathionine beta-lyase family protein involved in aluminum resistance
MAQVMGSEAAMVRRSFMSGTHAIASALYAVLRPGDEMVVVTGRCAIERLMRVTPHLIYSHPIDLAHNP